MIDFKDITYSYSHQSGVYNIDLRVKDEFCFLVGLTGSGKTTLLKLLYFDLFPRKSRNIKIFICKYQKIFDT